VTTLFLDVETLPGMTDAARDKARCDTHPPASMKRPETIEAWWRDEGDAAVEAKWRAQALDPASGELAAIGWAIDDGDPECLVRGLTEPEGDYLRRAIGVIEQRLQAAAKPADPLLAPWVEDLQPYVVGFNTMFDVGFLRSRCWSRRVPVPRWVPSAFARAPRDYGDAMLQFAGFGGRISLDRLSRALALRSPKEGGFDGSQVLDAWLAGNHLRIAEYCCSDVSATRAAWQIMRGEYGDVPAAAQEVQE